MNEGGPTGCTHIAVTSGADGCRIEGCHISDAYYGITIADSKFTFISNCKVDAAAGLTMVPADDSVRIYGVSVTGCTFGFLENYVPPVHTWGISIDTAGGPNENVESISLIGCVVYGFPGAGLLIGNAESVSVIGGKYSSNGQNPESPLYGAGIVITQACTQIRVVGADCSGVFHFWETVVSSPPPQFYGVSILTEATGVLVDGCDLTNNANGALYVGASGTDLRVVNCIGYNDQGTVLQSTAPPPSNPIRYNIGWANVSQGWYGPIVFYVKGAGDVTIDGNNTYLTDGAYTLSPGETASIAGTANRFLAVGR
jgi:parallel beta-helix repeat protein